MAAPFRSSSDARRAAGRRQQRCSPRSPRSQAALVVLTPLLPDVAGDLGVSTATAGQLRTVSGLAAGIAALLAGLLSTRVGLRELLVGAASSLIAAGSLAAPRRPTSRCWPSPRC